MIGMTIRELEALRAAGGGIEGVLDLDSVKVLVDEEHKGINQATTEQIAKRVITPRMGSSLVNDSGFARDIAINLIRASQVLLVGSEREVAQATQDVVLEKSEIERISSVTDIRP